MVLNPFKFWEDQRKASFPGAPPIPAKSPCVASVKSGYLYPASCCSA